MTESEKLKGCLFCGAMGDAAGGKYEGQPPSENIEIEFNGSISDDTQLTLATCEAVFDAVIISPEKVAKQFLLWFNQNRLSGLGSSTLKALRDLQVGAHWALSGRSGEFAAGNGAAMRIAPLAFKKNISQETIKDICNITHKNDEAYVGALAIVYAIKAAISGEWNASNNLFEILIPKLPDTNVRARMIEIQPMQSIEITALAQIFSPSGYVADSVPFAIFCAQKIFNTSLYEIFGSIIRSGGDTDTVCSLTGQMIGALLGIDALAADKRNEFTDKHIIHLIDQLSGSWIFE